MLNPIEGELENDLIDNSEDSIDEKRKKQRRWRKQRIENQRKRQRIMSREKERCMYEGVIRAFGGRCRLVVVGED